MKLSLRKVGRRLTMAAAVLLPASALFVAGQNTPLFAKAPGLAIGARVPAFRAMDQFGHERDFASLRAPHGLVLLFFRSADW